MNKREIARQFSLDTVIYDPELSTKAAKALSADMIEVSPEQCFDMDVVFDRHVYQNADFYRFPLIKESLHPKGREPKGKEEKLKQRMYDILNEQLNRVKQALSDLNVKFRSTAIIGDECDPHTVIITLYYHEEEEDQKDTKKKKQPAFSTNSIMPDRPALTERFAKFMAEYLMDKIHEDNIKEYHKSQHTPNYVPAEKVFDVIAKALCADKINAIPEIKQRIYKTANIAEDWPLRIVSAIPTNIENPVKPDTDLDCSEFMVYKQMTDGTWSLEKTENLKSAQMIITKNGFNLKRTHAIVVLHNLNPVPYKLFQETEEGLVELSPDEARGQKKLHVSWNRQV